MNYWRLILATMVIFGTGVVTGGLLVRHALPARPGRGLRVQANPRPTPTPGALKLDLLRRMQRELDLTPQQHDRIDHILSESQERAQHIMEPVKPLLAEELRRARQRFRDELTPEQRTRFDELVRQQQQHAHEGQRHAGQVQYAPGHPAPEGQAATNAPAASPQP